MPPTTAVTPCWVSGLHAGSQKTWASRWVDVDEAGGDHAPPGVDRGGSTLVEPADGHDPAVAQPDVGAARRGAGTVDDDTPCDRQIEHDPLLCRSAGPSSGGAPREIDVWAPFGPRRASWIPALGLGVVLIAMSARALVVKLVALPGRRDDLLALIERVRREIGAQPGCLAFNVHPEDDDTLWIYELYADDAAWATHRDGPEYQAIQSELRDLFAVPPEVHVLETALQHGREHRS